MEPNYLTHSFIAPSGAEFTIREQNGADDDILSNASDAKTLMNFSKFISAIVTHTTATESGKLSPEQAHLLPVLDKYCIILQSRILSLGEEFEFKYDWSNEPGKVDIIYYSQNLRELLLDYSNEPAEGDSLEAIPHYPIKGKTQGFEITTTSGNKLMFDLLNSHGESMFTNLPVDKQTKNSSLLIRNLKLQVADKYETVKNFSMFSVRDMLEIRTKIAEIDPTYVGLITIHHPNTSQSLQVPLMGLEGFFYLGEA